MDEEHTKHTRASVPPVVVFVKNVTVVFSFVVSAGPTIVKKLTREEIEKHGIEPLEEDPVYYYKIKTDAKYKGKVKIKIILPCEGRLTHGKLKKWTGEEWIELESHYNEEYHYIIGKSDKLSVFGVI